MTWTKTQIRAARKLPLAPVLRARGLQLHPLPDGNFRLAEHGDLVVKLCYWRWPSRGLDGNAIDFFMLVEGKSFNQAMETLTGTRNQDKPPRGRFENRSELLSHGSDRKY